MGSACGDPGQPASSCSSLTDSRHVAHVTSDVIRKPLRLVVLYRNLSTQSMRSAKNHKRRFCILERPLGLENKTCTWSLSSAHNPQCEELRFALVSP